MAGFKTRLKTETDPAVEYNFTDGEFRATADTDLTKFTSSGLRVKNFNASLGQLETVFEVDETGSIVEGNIDVSNVNVSAAGSDTEVQFNDGGSFGASASFTFDGAIVSTPQVNLSSNNTADTSGDIQIRDESSGDLFSLDNGNSPPVVAKYEGGGAFTFGGRTGSVGSNSVVLNGDSFDPNEASGFASAAFGANNTSSGSKAFTTGDGNVAAITWSIALGGGNTVDGGGNAFGTSSFAAGVGNTITSAPTFAIGDGNDVDSFDGGALGYDNEVKSDLNFAFGGNNRVGADRFINGDPEDSVAIGGSNIIDFGDRSIAIGAQNRNTSDASKSLGDSLRSRVFGGVATGIYNEDYLGQGGGQMTDISDLSTDDRIFVVGAGDDGTGNFDNRGRVDGLYVTMRDGTHIRHGLSVDGYNASLGQYETVFEIDETGTVVKGSVSVDGSNLDAAGPDNSIQFNNNQNFAGSSDLTWDGTNVNVNGEVRIAENGNGVIIPSSDGTEFRVKVKNDGTIVSEQL